MSFDASYLVWGKQIHLNELEVQENSFGLKVITSTLVLCLLHLLTTFTLVRSM